MTFTPSQLKAPPWTALLFLPPQQQAPIITFNPAAGVLDAWAPGGATATLQLNKTGSGNAGEDRFERFADVFCDGCKYDFDEREDKGTDDDNNEWTKTTASACDAHRHGLRSVLGLDGEIACEEGNDLSDLDDDDDDVEGNTIDITLPPLVYSYCINDETLSIGMAGWDWDASKQELRVTAGDGMLNVGYSMSQACWGNGDDPPFSGAITTFAASIFNEDLLTRPEFLQKKRRLEEREYKPIPSGTIVLRHPGSPVDALLFIDESDAPARGQLLASGIDADKLPMGALPLSRHQHMDIRGFITPPLPAPLADRCWFIAEKNQEMLGQIPFPPLHLR